MYVKFSYYKHFWGGGISASSEVSCDAGSMIL